MKHLKTYEIHDWKFSDTIVDKVMEENKLITRKDTHIQKNLHLNTIHLSRGWSLSKMADADVFKPSGDQS